MDGSGYILRAGETHMLRILNKRTPASAVCYGFDNQLSHWGFPGGASGKEPAANEMSVRSLSQEDSLEEGMVTPSRIHAWSGLPFPSPMQESEK